MKNLIGAAALAVLVTAGSAASAAPVSDQDIAKLDLLASGLIRLSESLTDAMQSLIDTHANGSGAYGCISDLNNYTQEANEDVGKLDMLFHISHGLAHPESERAVRRYEALYTGITLKHLSSMQQAIYSLAHSCNSAQVVAEKSPLIETEISGVLSLAAPTLREMESSAAAP